jgi:osmoprotectant transport system permease protein
VAKKTITAIILISLISGPISGSHSQPIRVASKHFNESYILSEIISQILEDAGFEVVRNTGLGGTLICFDALRNNAIDIYPEYTGTLNDEILKLDSRLSHSRLNDTLKNLFNLEISAPYGFNNTYAFAVKRTIAERYGLKQISDLRTHTELKMAFSYEFLKRKDGWGYLSRAYGLHNQPVGIEHGLAYQALDEMKVDLIDAYSTDGEIEKYNLILLEDDKNFFPKYFGVSFLRSDLDPGAKEVLQKLAGQISDTEMQQMNYKVLYEKKTFGEVASEFLKNKNLIRQDGVLKSGSIWQEIFSKTLVHLKITFIALGLGLLLAMPLGVLIYLFSSISRPVLYFAGLLQTIPSIALLALMIPLFGIGVVPAIVALFLYALLPILRNTAIGLFSVDPLLKKVATGMGLTKWQRLRYVEFPLAMPTIFAGIKTAAVINIGTATLAAFIGAGGLGEFIVTGLALNNVAIILRGAVPAAILAILVEFLFELMEKLFLPKHLQQKIGR